MAVLSFLSGRLVRTSEQPPAVLNCKGAFLESCRFVELLAPQDVKVFDTHGFLSGTTGPKEVMRPIFGCLSCLVKIGFILPEIVPKINALLRTCR